VERRRQVGGVVGFLSGVAGSPCAEIVRMPWRAPSARLRGDVVDESYVDLCRWARLELVEDYGVP